MKFFFCETHRETCCIFTLKSMYSMWKRTGGDTARCIRHGALITTEREFPDKKAAREWAGQGRKAA